MPRMDGQELCRLVREHQRARNMPAILLTARGLEFDEAEFARTYRLSNIIWKPFSPRELLRCVQEALHIEVPVES
jgi:CheY-like chemotaxis protein